MTNTHRIFHCIDTESFIFLHSLVDTHLDSFHFLDIVNDAVTNIYVWTCVFSSLGYIPWSGIAGLCGNSDISSNHQRPNSRYLGKMEVRQGQKADE